jgi:membrane associated rhomboid family serine protease
MIPISDENPVRITPFVTWALILGCCAVYVWEFQLGERFDAVLAAIAFTPADGTTATGLPILKAAPLKAILYSMFLHGSIIHLGGNMLYLGVFGNNIEDAMGHIKFALFYLICGYAAAFVMAYIDPSSTVPVVGASGAISGALAAYVLLYPRARVHVIVPLGIIFYPLRISAVWVVGSWFLFQLVFALLSHPKPGEGGTAWWAHVGGFAAGIVLTPLLKSRYVPLFGRVRRGPWT